MYEAGFSPICPPLYLPLFLNDAVPEEHKSGIDMSRDLLRRSHVLVVCGHSMTEAMKNDIAVAQRLGRELMTPSELATMPGDKCILQLRGLPPFFSPKYDLKQHPNYKYTSEADKQKNAFDLDKLINRRRRPGLNEACEVYEIDVSDTGPVSEDEDILNYDDVDDPDAYV